MALTLNLIHQLSALLSDCVILSALVVSCSPSGAVGVPAVLQRNSGLPGISHLYLHHLWISWPCGHMAQVPSTHLIACSSVRLWKLGVYMHVNTWTLHLLYDCWICHFKTTLINILPSCRDWLLFSQKSICQKLEVWQAAIHCERNIQIISWCCPPAFMTQKLPSGAPRRSWSRADLMQMFSDM